VVVKRNEVIFFWARSCFIFGKRDISEIMAYWATCLGWMTMEEIVEFNA
jgi:hypothetical protein